MIDRRFRGPPDSANGGYACGLVAAAIEPLGPVEATLRSPPALGRPLERALREDGEAELRDGDQVVAEARAAPDFELELPDPIDFDAAEAAGRDCPWRDDHLYPMCFVCGPERTSPDGLGILHGPVDRRELLADVWTPHPSHADPTGRVDPLLVWSVLDCPTGHAAMWFERTGNPFLLGRLTARVERLPRAGERLVVLGWPLERDGRKRFGASAIFSESGEPLAYARGTWIELR